MNHRTILVVDDEPKLVRLVSEILQVAGYQVITASSGEKAIVAAIDRQPDLILLDIVLLGGVDGFEAATRIRQFSQVPIIMLTAKIKEVDKLRGFNAGIDDYITKPFSAQELLARIGAVLKRAGDQPYPQPVTEIRINNLHINLVNRTVTRDAERLHLTPTEYRLLEVLAQHADSVLSKEQLLSDVWGPEYRDDVDYLRTYIHFLRKKIEINPADPEIILSSQGIGYMLTTRPQPE